MHRDVASAYLAVGARIGGLFAVSAVVYRTLGLEAFAVFNLIRSTVGLLNYTGLGLAPAMVHMLAEAKSAPRPAPPVTPAHAVDPVPADGSPVIPYETPRPPKQWAEPDPAVRVVISGGQLALNLAIIGWLAAGFYAQYAPRIHGFSPQAAPGAGGFAAGLGVAVVLRLLGEPSGSVLQVLGRQALDNSLLAAAEAVAAIATLVAVAAGGTLSAVGGCYAATGVALLLCRYWARVRLAPELTLVHSRAHWPTQKALLAFGSLVTLAQLADFLYAPTDYILISWLLKLTDVATYAPAVQIDAGLLTLVTGLGAVLLPRSAVAHGAGDTNLVRRYYLRGTLAGTALLAAAALAVWALSPWILRLWLGADMPATRAILPLVLVHTVVGGSGAVGRSVLLGMGKVKPFTASVLVAGAANVVLSYVFVRYFEWGLKGIVLGTIIAVVARAGIWTPWYVLRSLKQAELTPAASAPSSPTSG
jgi:O-antigen/teichoic acid export membrane protein